MLVALILNLLGFSDEEIAEDYHVTERYKEDLFSPSVVQTVGIPSLRICNSHPHVMHEILTYIRNKYGSIPVPSSKGTFFRAGTERLVQLLQQKGEDGAGGKVVDHRS